MKIRSFSLFYSGFAIRSILLLLFTILIQKSAFSTSYFSIASGNWNSNTTWSTTNGGAAVGSGVFPVAGDTVNVMDGFTVTVNVNSACAVLQIGATAATGPGQIGVLRFNSNVKLTVRVSVTVGGNGNTNRRGTLRFASGSILDAGSVILGNPGATPANTDSITMASGGTMITGSLTVSGGTGHVWVRGTGKVVLKANNTLPSTIFTNFNKLTINTGTTTTGVDITTISDSLTVEAGATLSVGHAIGGTTAPTVTYLYCGAVTGSTISGASTLNLGGNIYVKREGTGTDDANISCLLALGGTRTITVENDGSSATDLTISNVISGSAGITKAGAGKMVLSGNNTFSGLTTVSTGTLNLQHANATGTTARGISVTSGADIEIEGGISFASDTLIINGTGTTGNYAFLNNSGTNTWNGPVNVGSAGAVISSGSTGTMTIAGRIAMSGNLTLQGSSTNSNVVSGIISGGFNVKKSGTGTWGLSNANTFTAGVTHHNGKLNINNSQALGTIAGIFRIGGNGVSVTIDNTTAAAITTLNYQMVWGDDFTFTGTQNLNLGTGTVTLSADRQVTVSAGLLSVLGTISAASQSLTKAGAGTLTFGANSVSFTNLTISAGVLTSTSTTLTLSGNFTNNATFSNNSGNVTFSSAGAQSISGSAVTTFSNMSRTGGGTLTLNKSANISNLLNITSGLIATTSTNFLNFADNATVSGGSNTAYISGPVQKTGNDAFVFPSGKGGRWARIGISAPSSTTDAYMAEYFNSMHSDTANKGSGVKRVSYKEYWNLSRTAGTSTVTVTLYFEDGAFSGITNLSTSDVFVGRYSGSQWQDLGGSRGVSGTTSAGTVSMASISSFGDFTFASQGGLNPLPVKLISFTGTCEGNLTRLQWTTATEINNDFFTVETSTDGRTWDPIQNIKGAGNSSQLIRYALTLPNPLNSDKFYRLKQTDFDGTFDYSQTILVKDCNQSDLKRVVIFPDPAGDLINIQVSADPLTITSVSIIDPQGKVVFHQNNFSSSIEVNYLPKGIYYLQILHEGGDVVKKLWVKN